MTSTTAAIPNEDSQAAVWAKSEGSYPGSEREALSSIDPTSRRRSPLERHFAVAVVLAGLAILSGNDADADLWGHVRYGQDVWRSGRLPLTATYTFTAPDHPWINHENFSELAFARIVDAAGDSGLMWLQCLMGLTVVGLMFWWSRRHGAGLIATSVVLLLVAKNLAPSWTVRPQLFTFTFFAALLALLDRCCGSLSPARKAESGKRKAGSPPSAFGFRSGGWLWLAVPLFAVWANTHGGFVAGWLIMAMYLGCRSLELLWSERRQARPQMAAYAKLLLVSGLATLLTPYGVRLPAWLVGALGWPRPEISEWAELSLGNEAFLPFAMLAGLTAVAWLAHLIHFLLGRRNTARDPESDPLSPPGLAPTVVLALTAWQSVLHERHIPFFAIAAGLWAAPHLEWLLSRVRDWQSSVVVVAPMSRRSRLVLTAGAWLVSGILIGLVGLNLRGLMVDKGVYPVEAVSFMSRHGLKGRLVAFFDWAQYAIVALGSGTQVAFDGRFRTCYPQEVIDMHFDFVLGDLPGRRWRSPNSPPIDGARVLRFGQPDLVLLSRKFPHAVEVMQNQSDWVILYQDALAQVWGRKEKYDDPASPDYLPSEERQISARSQTGFVPWPALPAI